MENCQIEHCGKAAYKEGLCQEHSLAKDNDSKSTLNFEYVMHVGLLIGGRILNQVLAWYDQLFSLKEKDVVLVHKNLAKHYRKKGDIAKAIQSLKKVVELDPSAQNSDLMVMLGDYYVLSGNLSDAEISYKMALKKNPAAVEAAMGLAGVSQRQNDLDNSIGYLEAVLKIQPTNHAALYELGVAYDKKKDHQKAIDCLKSAVDSAPNSVKYHQHLGFMYESIGAHAEAIPHFKKVLELEHGRTA